MPKKLFFSESPVAQRQPKTDRLILGSYLKNATLSKLLDEKELRAGHAILSHWAELERSGRLGKLNETQMQGDFLAEVFGKALGYAGPLDGNEIWHREQHHQIAGETPDAVLGFFQQSSDHKPLAVVELKGPNVHLDRHRSNGRTAVGQCWDYLVNTPPECRWGIVSNIVSFRLYERSSTKGAYEHFTLQSLVDFDVYKQFHVLFHRQGLIEKILARGPRAVELLKESMNRQQEVSETLYSAYSTNRIGLIAELHFKQKHPLDQSIEMAQRLLDRIMFIAFCEDRHLLPKETIPKAYSVAGFHAVTNPRWQNFKNLFRFIDVGNETHGIPQYNGGLFAAHAVDELELPDDPWTNFFKTISGYDFADEVNLDVLGHLFERSITELEKLKESGLFGGDPEKTRRYAQMPQSAKRKQLGIYYTPQELTSLIVQYAVDELIAQRFATAAVRYGIPQEQAQRAVAPDDRKYWNECLGILRSLKIVDPACGSGAFLFQAYTALEQRYGEVLGHLEQLKDPDAKSLTAQVPTFILQENLYGVDLSAEAVEITQLALWIRSASPGQLLAKLSANIVHGNSLVHDAEVHAGGFDWRSRFPEVFDRPEAGFDCVIGNPPWERLDLAEREFFSLPAPEIATATTGAKRNRLVEELKSSNPTLFRQYQTIKASVDDQRVYCQSSGHYPLTGKGRTNCYAVFAELASQLVASHGRVGLLVPSGIASDMTTKDFFASVAESSRLIRLIDFENKKVFFPEVHASFKFCILNFGGVEMITPQADFVFFAHSTEELENRSRHIALSAADIKLLNPNTRTCPIFRTRRDAEITKAIYRRVPILVDTGRKGPTGNPWNVRFKQGVFNQTTDSGLFLEAPHLKRDGYKQDGNRWKKGKNFYLPLYEAKMFRPYDHRHGSAFTNTDVWFQQGHTTETTTVEHQNPEFAVFPRWWADETDILSRQVHVPALIAFRNIARSTDTRTFIACLIPFSGVINSAPYLSFTKDHAWRRRCCLVANMCSIPLDFIVKNKLGGTNLNFFIVEQLPLLTPDTYAKPCPWDHRTTLEAWISERVLKLTCTAEDMLPLAEACQFTGGSFQTEYHGRLHKWDEIERTELMAELDAAYFHLYDLNRDDVEYILSTFKGIHDQRTLLPGHVSLAQRIVQRFVELSFPA
ncbi:MAG: DNA methyltransferase [Planctomycetaceae bacterium]|nr:DNA methyltransferase [Planctomycetaceae bacterium]